MLVFQSFLCKKNKQVNNLILIELLEFELAYSKSEDKSSTSKSWKIDNQYLSCETQLNASDGSNVTKPLTKVLLDLVWYTLNGKA